MLFASLLIAALPAAAQAEGSRIVFDCQIVSRCDAAGACTPATTMQRFNLTPRDRAADGSGSYSISYDEIEAEAQAPDGLRLFRWREGDRDRQTLLLNDDSNATWHRLRDGDAAKTSIEFLRCEILQ